MAILSRMAKLGIPLTVAAATAGALFYDDIRGRFSVKAEQPATPPTAPSSLAFSSSVDTDLFPRNKWHSNWDSRDPFSLVDREEYNAADPASRKEMLQKVKATATRNIFLIRHGQYFMETEEKNLTPLGREQAILLGKRLAQSGQKFDVLIMSSMQRASETAHLILNELAPLPTRVDSILEEGAPYPPEPPITDWRPKQKGSRIEAAFRKYIHRASPKQKQDTYEIFVCHGNVIRYFVCRALQFPAEGWLRMSLGNCSITWLVIRPNGHVSLRTLGDIGHLPREKITFK